MNEPPSQDIQRFGPAAARRIRRFACTIAAGWILLTPSLIHPPVEPPLSKKPQTRPRTASTDMTPCELKPVSFPIPDGIRAQVRFWDKIFNQYSQSQVVVHDDWYLDVIYEVADLGTSPQETIANLKEKYTRNLKRLSETWDAHQPDPDSESSRIRNLFANLPETERFPHRDAFKRLRIQYGLKETMHQGVRDGQGYIEDMKQILRAYDLPPELVWLALIDSRFQLDSVSQRGATGIWQIMKRTARQYGMEINPLVDDRRDPLISTRVAARHLAHNYEVLQSWPLAVTAYNYGLQGTVNAVKAVQSDDITRIIHEFDSLSFQFSSRNFYAQFLAAIITASNAIATQENPPRMRLAEMTIGYRLPDFIAADALAHHLDILVEDIGRLNPSLLPAAFASGNMLPKGFILRLPAVVGPSLADAYAAIPDELKFDTHPVVSRAHRVKRGETLSQIAQYHDVSLRHLLQFNNIRNPQHIRTGQHLSIPIQLMALDRPKPNQTADVAKLD